MPTPPLTRRTLARRLAGAAALLASSATLAPAARAQGNLVPGKDFIQLDKPVPVPGQGKIEVIEFFWYGCPHCYAFEPFLVPWVAKLPADVHFRRVPYGFDEVLRETHQRVFCTLEALGLVDAMHEKVYARFHVEKKPIDSEADMLNFASLNGLDVAKVKAAWSSFAVDAKMKQYKALCEAYTVDFTPVLGIQGRFLTTPRTDKDGPRTLAATDSLINLVRKGG
jgi:protein dithiol oxidoreductase (disulfide-forming)